MCFQIENMCDVHASWFNMRQRDMFRFGRTLNCFSLVCVLFGLSLKFMIVAFNYTTHTQGTENRISFSFELRHYERGIFFAFRVCWPFSRSRCYMDFVFAFEYNVSLRFRSIEASISSAAKQFRTDSFLSSTVVFDVERLMLNDSMRGIRLMLT